MSDFPAPLSGQVVLEAIACREADAGEIKVVRMLDFTESGRCVASEFVPVKLGDRVLVPCERVRRYRKKGKKYLIAEGRDCVARFKE